MKSLLLKVWKKLNLPANWQLFFMRRVNDQFLVGVTGIFFDKQNRILLVKHTYRGNGKWSLPGGYLESGEHPKEGIEREIKEETGFIVSADTRIKIRTDRDAARLDITYAGEFIGGTFIPSKEVKVAKLFSYNQLPDINTGQLIFIDKAMSIRKNVDMYS